MSDSSKDSDSQLSGFIDKVRESAENAYVRHMQKGTMSFPCDENGYVLPLLSIEGVNNSSASLRRRQKRLLKNLHQAEDAVYNCETEFLTSLAGIRNSITCFEPSTTRSTTKGGSTAVQLCGQKEFHVDDAKRLFSWSSFRYQKHLESAMIAAGVSKDTGAPVVDEKKSREAKATKRAVGERVIRRRKGCVVRPVKMKKLK